MKLLDLINSDFVNDDTTIIVSRPIIGKLVDMRKGKWYLDNILDLMQFNVSKFDYHVFDNQLTVLLYMED